MKKNEKASQLKQKSSTLKSDRTTASRLFCGRCHRLLNAISSTFTTKKINNESISNTCRICGQMMVLACGQHIANEFECKNFFSRFCSHPRCALNENWILRDHCVLNQFESKKFYLCSCCLNAFLILQRSAKFFNNCCSGCSETKLNHHLHSMNYLDQICDQKKENDLKDQNLSDKLMGENEQFMNLKQNSLNQNTNQIVDQTSSMINKTSSDNLISDLNSAAENESDESISESRDDSKK